MSKEKIMTDCKLFEAWLCVVVTVTVSFVSPAIGAKEIVWYKLTQPPYYTQDGQGIHDQIIDCFIERLPDYSHRFLKSNVARALCEIKAKKNAILLGIYKTPDRQQYMLYPDISLYLNMNTVLVVRKEDSKKIAPFIDADRNADIEQIAVSKRFVIGISTGRKYSGIIDQVIDRYSGAHIFYSRASEDIVTGHLKMLVNKRIDAYFDQPVSVPSALKQLGQKEDTVTFFSISGLQRYEPVWLGLPKNEWGRKMKQRLTKVLQEPGMIEKFAQFYMERIDGSLRPSYRKEFQDFYHSLSDTDTGAE